MLLNVAVIYLSITAFLGTYGLFFAAFHPNPFLYEFSKYLAILFLLVYMPLSITFMIKNKLKVMKAFRTEFKFYGFTFAGLPFLFVFFAYVHYMATLKGAPSIYTSIFGESYSRSVTITDKRLWGKRDRQEEIKLSGFDIGFPVSRRYYSSVVVGQEINVTAVESSMGIKIDFAMP
ncbi:hypothetical protein [Endozoicomonas atrinae]|uniref:hypothetical protein n=1 Tax=Endozoicomonas atrinae TaxID=1333660 RepID=UPI003AFF6895